jgi:methionyl-tRNA formyltransferase
MDNHMALKIVFAGTPAFAATALHALLTSPHEIIAVYTQPDRPAGRGLKLTSSPVKTLALAHHLPLQQPSTLKDPQQQAKLADLRADIMVVAAYGMLLPAAVLAMPRLGCINIHPSLLPRWRGAAPIQRTIFAGDQVTGVTIMQMEAGLDTGPMLLQREYVLAADETTQTLHDKLAAMGAAALLDTLTLLEQNKLTAQPQDNALAIYAAKISKEEAQLDWAQPAYTLEHKIRAFNPWPVAYTQWQQQSLRIWLAKTVTEKSNAAPGTLLHAGQEGIDIATGSGVLRLLQLQLPGGKVLSAVDFYNSHLATLIPGKLFS